MAFDGAYLHCIKQELQPLIGSRIDKIYQPSRDELILSFRGKGSAVKVLFSISADAARVHITATSPENPQKPPMFCMLLRKHLLGGKLEAVEQDGLERILQLRISCRNELGDLVSLTLVCEIMGRYSNVILVNEHHRIIDSLHRVDEEISRVRLVLPAMEYSLPPREKRICLLTADSTEIRHGLKQAEAMPLAKGLISLFEGVSPIVAREWEYYAGKGEPLRFPLDSERLVRLQFIIEQTAEMLKAPQKRCYMTIRTKEGQLKDFSYFRIRQYGALMITAEYPTASAALDAFFAQRDQYARIKQRANDLFRFLVHASDRIGKRIANQRAELLACEPMEKDKRYGDLLAANLYRIQRGDSSVTVEDFYEPEAPLTEIPLEERLSPSQNVQLYYKKYKKASTAKKILTERIEDGIQEQQYIESVFDALTRAECEADIIGLRQELIEQGYLRENRRKGKPQKPVQPIHYRTDDGYDVYVGRNNLQNDRLTLKFAEKRDIWLHTQAIHGAHVVLVTNGETPPSRSLEQAACLAAFHSKGRDSSRVKVDYCPARYVKKPAGARPGMVIYTDYRTAFVEPDAALAKRLRVDHP